MTIRSSPRGSTLPTPARSGSTPHIRRVETPDSTALRHGTDRPSIPATTGQDLPVCSRILWMRCPIDLPGVSVVLSLCSVPAASSAMPSPLNSVAPSCHQQRPGGLLRHGPRVYAPPHAEAPASGCPPVASTSSQPESGPGDRSARPGGNDRTTTAVMVRSYVLTPTVSNASRPAAPSPR